MGFLPRDGYGMLQTVFKVVVLYQILFAVVLSWMCM